MCDDSRFADIDPRDEDRAPFMVDLISRDLDEDIRNEKDLVAPSREDDEWYRKEPELTREEKEDKVLENVIYEFGGGRDELEALREEIRFGGGKLGKDEKIDIISAHTDQRVAGYL